MKKNIIVWDLGGTNCTAGIISIDDNDQLHCIKSRTIKLRDAHSLTDLISKLDKALGIKLSDADAICIGASGHYDGRIIQHENPYPYVMNIADIAKIQQWPAFAVIHDYASIVCSTFTNHIDHTNNVTKLNNAKIQPYQRRVALGVGTGLGLKDGILFSDGNFWLGQNEAGHIGLTTPPLAERHDFLRHQDFIQFLTTEFKNEPITFEKVLSGYGMVRLYRFLYTNDTIITPEQVGEQLQADQLPELLDFFAWYLGLFVGTVQLSFMPAGGIYITGGVLLNHQQIFRHDGFQRGIEAIPAYLNQRKEYPLMVLPNSESALYGCGYYAKQKLVSKLPIEYANVAN